MTAITVARRVASSRIGDTKSTRATDLRSPETISISEPGLTFPASAGERATVTETRDRLATRNSSASPATVCPRVTLRETTRSEEHTSELQSLMRNSYAVFCLKTKKNNIQTRNTYDNNERQRSH